MEKLALTIEEACKLVGIGRTKGYELCANGQWPTIRIGRAVRVPVDGLKQWLARQSSPANLEEPARDGRGVPLGHVGRQT